MGRARSGYHDFESNIDYLIVADYYSKYIDVQQLRDKTSSSVINAMKYMFATHGIPEEIISDNMPFASREIQAFANEWGFTTSPGYPKSNGFAERNVQTIKNLLMKPLMMEETRTWHPYTAAASVPS